MLTRRLRVVVADDHTYVRSLVRQLLELEPDIQVVAEAGTAEHLYAAISEHEPDALVLDWAIPGHGGTRALANLHQRWPTLPIVSLSIHETDGYEDAALAAGASAYVSKSDPDMLAARVRRAVHSRPKTTRWTAD